MSEATEKKPAVKTPAPKTSPPKQSVVDPKATKVIAQWKTDSPLVSCRFEPKGDYVFAGGQDNAIYRWETATGKRIAIKGHESWVRDFAFLPNNQTMVACDYAGRLTWWPVAGDAPKAIRTIDAHQGWARCVSISPNGKTLATGGNDNLVKLWNAQTGEKINELRGHERHVYSTFFHPKENILLSGDLMGNVKQWDLASGKETRAFENKDHHKFDLKFRADYGGIRSIDISPDGKHLAFAGLHKCTNAFAGINEPLVTRYDFQTQKRVESHEAKMKALSWRALFHPEGFLISAAGGGAGGYLLFWKDAAKVIHQFKLPNIARDMDLHPDGLRIATAHSDNHLRISRMSNS